MQKIKEFVFSYISQIIIVLFHLVGLGLYFLVDSKEYFLSTVGIHLILMSILVILGQKEKNKSFFLFLFITAIVGFGVEVIGIETGKIFGVYEYGKSLGAKFLGVPLLIGINWMVLLYSSGIVIEWVGFKNRISKYLGIGAFMVLSDLFLEKIAQQLDYWHWFENKIPQQNYIAWYIISMLLGVLFFEMKFKKENPVALLFYFTQLIFLICLQF